MSQSIRWVVRGVNGRIRAVFGWPGVITDRSVVIITAGEVKFGSATVQETPPFQDFFYVNGDADIWISNICPHMNLRSNPPDRGSVKFILHVDYPSPLDVAITITVEDNLPVEIQGYQR